MKERETIDKYECVNEKMPYKTDEEKRLLRNKINSKTRNTEKAKLKKAENGKRRVPCPMCEKMFSNNYLHIHKKTQH
jgi:hypothetical protein